MHNNILNIYNKKLNLNPKYLQNKRKNNYLNTIKKYSNKLNK